MNPEREKVIEKLAEWLCHHDWHLAGVSFKEIPERDKGFWRNHARQLLADNPGLAVVEREVESTDWMKEAGYVKEIKE